MAVKFGTGGWRAIIGDEFIKSNINLVCFALANQLQNKQGNKLFIIGYDRRFLSKKAADWCATVIASKGLKVKIIEGEAPTPLIMYMVKHYDCVGGLAVTASHNPADYNGIKIFTRGGIDADENFTSELEKNIEALDIKQEENCLIDLNTLINNKMIEYFNPINQYIDSVLNTLNTDAIKNSNLKIVIDPMYGVSKIALQTILLTCRCNVDIIHDRHDTLFGGRLPTPTATTLNGLRNYVLEHKCDIGIATDGDADRLGVINDKCEFLHPNKILVILYYYLLEYKGWKGDCVRNIATTHMMDKIAQTYNQNCYEVPVGFKHISSKMAQTDSIIGGESSGGLTVKGHIQGKDGIYAASLLIEMMATTNMSLSQIWEIIENKFGKFEMEEDDFKFSVTRKNEIEKLIMQDKLLPSFDLEIEKVSYVDGCKVYFKNGGWIIVRFSGTEPLLRIFCEMDNKILAKEQINKFTTFLNL